MPHHAEPRHHLSRAALAVALGAAGLVAAAGPASAEVLLPDSPQGSTDPADYQSEGVDSAPQPEQPYVDGGPAASVLESVNGFVGEPAQGLLGGNLPIPRG